MRKLLAISLLTSLLLLLTACPSPTTTKAPELSITSEAETIALTASYELTGTIMFDGAGTLMYMVDTAEAKELPYEDGKFAMTFKGSDLTAGEHTITVTASAAGHKDVVQTVKVTVQAATEQ